MLHEITGALAMSLQRTVMIGDTTHDLAMARSAGTSSIGVTYGAHPRAQLEGAGALALVDDVAELRTWLMRTR